jgi:hypothetical protein
VPAWPDLLVATDRGLLLLLGGRFYGSDDEGQHYGITWDERALFVSAGASLRRLAPDADGLRREDVPYANGAGKIHQILFHDGRLLVANTGKNRVDVVDAASGATTSHDLNAVGDERDVHHLNSLAVGSDGSIWTCNHNRGPSFVDRFDAAFRHRERVDGVGTCNHNLFLEDGALLTLSSSCGTVTVVDASGGRRERPLDFARADAECRFARGWARPPDVWVVAGSRMAGQAATRSGGVLLMLDPDWRPVDAVRLPVAAQVYEVRAIGGPDRTHHELPFPFDPGRLAVRALV